MPRRPREDDYGDVSTYHHANTVVDRAIYQSDDGRLTHSDAAQPRPKKRKLAPTHLKDPYASWRPSLDEDIDDPSTFDEDEDEDKTLFDDPSGQESENRKQYASSDDPNGVWRPHAIELLHELFRFGGLGDSLAKPRCSTCAAVYSPNNDTRLLRCNSCCPLLECLGCCVQRHQTMPLHVIKEWTGSYFKTVSLQSLGLVYQLGHQGLPCLTPKATVRHMVVIDTNGVHQVSFRYCDCSPTHKPSNIQQLMRNGWYPATPTDPRTCATFNVLDLFRELNVRATVNGSDFFGTLVGLTNPLEKAKVPDCRKAFTRMARQWAFLHRVKRSGVGLMLDSLSDIQPGSLAVLCWACPHLNINLPEGWETLDSKYSYLYMPILALDANFRLKNVLRSNEKSDPELAPGSAYFVSGTEYKDFLKDYVSEEDISTCIAFAALMEKDTKLTTGLKTSGVAGCACARHELIRPQGIGDLQKGERYANMDYVFFSAVKNFGLPRLAASYDIICQWRQKLWERNANLPKELQLDPTQVELTFGLPTWHAVAHEISCRAANALTYQDGVGRTDGEGIERIWSLLNPSSYATKEMGEGARHDNLDDRIDHHNFEKNIGTKKLLARRLRIAINERDRQIANFEFNDQGLDPELRAEWKQMVVDWKADRSKPNPYLLTDACKGLSEVEIRAEIREEEKKKARERRQTLRQKTPSAFLAIGLELEDLQLKIRQDNNSKHITPFQKTTVANRRRTFFTKLKKFRELQHIYVPGAITAVELEEAQQSPTSPCHAEDVRLWLPSDFNIADRPAACAPQVVELELRLREGRCHDSIITLRHFLHAKQYFIAFQNANVTGQNTSTRAKGIIDETGEKVDAAAARYRRSRVALLFLRGATSLDEYPELSSGDITLDVVTDPDLLSIAKLAGTKRKWQHIGTGTKVASWIWTYGGGPTEEEGAVSHTARVEWCKALARKDRWTEEVSIIREEMKRVLRFLDWQISWWEIMTPELDSRSPTAAVTAGMRAYTAQQADLLRSISEDFRIHWRHR